MVVKRDNLLWVVNVLKKIVYSINVISDKPHNPLVNSGAIMSAALLLHLAKPELEGMANKYDFVFDCFKVSNCYNLAITNLEIIHKFCNVLSWCCSVVLSFT